MKPKLLTALFIASLILPVFAHAETRLRMSVPFAGKTEIQLLVSTGTRVLLRFEQGTVSAHFDNGDSQDIITGLSRDDMLNGQWGIHTDDFNFDGYQDFAVDMAYGYGGVNINSVIYSFDPANGRFVKMLEAFNIDALPQSEELRTGQKSGPRYYTTTYRFSRGNPYKYKETTTMGGDLELVELYDQSGKTLQRIIVDLIAEFSGLKPAKRKISVDRAQLYSRAEEQFKSKAYLIFNDEVEIIDVRGDWDEWFEIRYTGKKKTIERWIKSDDIIG